MGLEDTNASNTSALSRLPTLPTLPTSDCVLADLLKPVTVVFEVTKDMRAPSADDGFLLREQRHVRSNGASNCGVERGTGAFAGEAKRVGIEKGRYL